MPYPFLIVVSSFRLLPGRLRPVIAHRAAAGRPVAVVLASVAGIVAALASPQWLYAATLAVPAQYTSIQAALNAAGPGDVVEVSNGTYNEKIVFVSSGLPGQPIVLSAKSGHSPVIDGSNVAGSDIVLIDNRSYVQIRGFEIVNNLGVNDGSGVRVTGSGSGIEIRDNRIHEIRGRNAMGITVYGTGDPVPVSSLVIDNNEIFDCDPRPSEALVLNGNVDGFVVSNNYVHDVNNIAIDFIGGETSIQPNSSLVARNGICSGNLVERCGSGFSGGIYVDGGRDIVIENNSVTACDLGIEVGAENAGIVAQNVTVRNNVLFDNRAAGIVFGGYSASVGRADNNTFRGNTLYRNDRDFEGFGEIWVQYGDGNTVANNLVYANSQNVFVASFNASSGNVFNYNLYYADAGAGAAEFSLNNQSYSGFASWQASGQDGASLFADPLFLDAAATDFHISAASPAVDAGDPAYTPALTELDLDLSTRLSGAAVDIGADEVTCGDNVVDPGEECDDGNTTNGDGCDNNCTFSACGNGIVAGAEQCDDGNLAGGDCCDASCAFEAAGSACSDGEPCTLLDQCDGAGTCLADASPDPACLQPLAAGKSSLKLKDKGSRDLLLWKWGKGPDVALPALAQPTVSDDYVLCIYKNSGGVSTLLSSTTAPAGASWSDLGAKGFKYKDSTRTPDGLKTVGARPGSGGKARFKVKGGRENLSITGLGFAAGDFLTAQLHAGSAACFGGVYSSPFKKNDGSQLKDGSD